jgi:hypothetical protein
MTIIHQLQAQGQHLQLTELMKKELDKVPHNKVILKYTTYIYIYTHIKRK